FAVVSAHGFPPAQPTSAKAAIAKAAIVAEPILPASTVTSYTAVVCADKQRTSCKGTPCTLASRQPEPLWSPTDQPFRRPPTRTSTVRATSDEDGARRC